MKDKIVDFALSILVALLILSTVLLIDRLAYQNRIYTKLFVTPEPNYQLPKGYTLRYSAKEKGYAIQVGDEYLYEGKFGTMPMYLSISKPTICFDSDIAKGYAHKYITKEADKITDFK
jgi:hypothetical protein